MKRKRNKIQIFFVLKKTEDNVNLNTKKKLSKLCNVVRCCIWVRERVEVEHKSRKVDSVQQNNTTTPYIYVVLHKKKMKKNIGGCKLQQNCVVYFFLPLLVQTKEWLNE